MRYAVTTKLECKQVKVYELKDILTAIILKRTFPHEWYWWLTGYDSLLRYEGEERIKYLCKAFEESVSEMIPLNSVSQTPRFTDEKTEH